MEQPMFCVGDRVVCVNSSPINTPIPTGLIEGKTYTVLAVTRCLCCSSVVVDVGVDLIGEGVTCSTCDTLFPIKVEWKKQIRFVPVQTNDHLESEITEALKGIPETL